MGARGRARDCWRHCATIVKVALADGAVLAVVPLVFNSGKPPRQISCIAAGNDSQAIMRTGGEDQRRGVFCN